MPRWPERTAVAVRVIGLHRDPEREKIDLREILSAFWVEDRLTRGSAATAVNTAIN